MGDININYLKANDNKAIKSILELYGFKRIVEEVTKVTMRTKSLIDVILSNGRGSIMKTEVILTSLTDHDMVGCIRKLNHVKYQLKTINCRNYCKYDPQEMCRDLKSKPWELFFQMTNVNNVWYYLKTIVVTTFEKHAPMIEKKVKGRSWPWLKSDLKKHMNEREQLLRKARRTDKELDLSSYKRKRNFYTNAIRFAKGQYHKNLIQEKSTTQEIFEN